MKLITIIIPVYNEKETIEEILNKIVSLKVDKQIIVIDDFSSDGSREIIQNNKHKIDNLIFKKQIEFLTIFYGKIFA